MIDVTRTPASVAVLPAYTVTARVLHWITAALVLTMVPLGFVIANEWGGSQQERLYDLHKSVGALLIPVVVIRLIYRLFESPQPLPADIPAIQQFAAHAMHWVLYTLLIVQPLVGWIGTSAYPAPVPVFGWFELPSIWWENRAFSDRMMQLHRWLGILIGILAVLHIAAALHHHFVRKDRILMRMLTG
jgi:cytochrome b561